MDTLTSYLLGQKIQDIRVELTKMNKKINAWENEFPTDIKNINQKLDELNKGKKFLLPEKLRKLEKSLSELENQVQFNKSIINVK